METAWEIDFGVEMATSPATFAGTTPAYLYGIPATESLRVDDLLDFTNHDLFPSLSSFPTGDDASDDLHRAGEEFSAVDVAVAGGLDASFPDDIYIPYEDAAELEWLSKFMEDSFSDAPSYHFVASTASSENSKLPAAAPGACGRAARNKRSSEISASSSSSSSSDSPNPRSKKKQGNSAYGGTRRCTHCLSEKTPQWRTGPLGPKTLCNACGVRFKSGRLVPEYRPAASPTFVLTQHSNSHRKVMELRRQKEFLILRGSDDVSDFSSELLCKDYEVC